MEKHKPPTPVLPSGALPDENRIQQSIVIWFTNTYCLAHHTPRSLILHIPNQNQHHLTGMGVLAGASDLIVIHAPSLSHLWVEVKDHKGTQSDAQKAFQKRIEALGYRYVLCRSLASFQAVIWGLEGHSQDQIDEWYKQ